MAIDKTRQTLQHLRTSTAGAQVKVGDLLPGEIAVRYSHENPALMIEDADQHIVEFISSGAVHTAIQNINNSITAEFEQFSSYTVSEIEGLHKRDDALESAITETNIAVEKLSGDVEITIDALSGSAYARDEALAKDIKDLSGATESAIAALEQADGNLSDRAKNLETAVSSLTTNYATKAYVDATSADLQTKIETLRTDASTSAKTLDDKVAGLSAGTLADLASEKAAREQADGNLSNRATDLETAVSSLTTNYATKAYVDATSADLQTKIETLRTDASASAKTLDDKIAGLSAGTLADLASEKAAREQADGDISAALSAVSAATVTAVQGASLGEVKSSDANYTKQSDAQMSVVDNQITLDLRYLSIDCGEF